MSDRKYRQRGYQDDDGGARRERPPKTPRERPDGPRGRGLGRPTAAVFRCAVCGARLAGGSVALEATCSGCGADLHSCTHCRHFDSAARNECRQPVAERIANKAKRNRCELFTPRVTAEAASPPAQSDRPDDAKSAFDALFKL